jgi:hypothetical protein
LGASIPALRWALRWALSSTQAITGLKNKHRVKIRPKNKILKNVIPGAQAPCKSGSAKAHPCGLGKILTPDPVLNREKGRLVALP